MDKAMKVISDKKPTKEDTGLKSKDYKTES